MPHINPWFVAAAVVIPTFMEVLDTTIANVALRYIAGGLSAPVTDSEWVITSYLAANAIILPISGWLASRLGRRNYFLGVDRRVYARLGAVRHGDELDADAIFFRVLQGLAGGGLQPSSQGCCSTVSAGEAGAGTDGVRRRGASGAGRWADARRLDHGQLRLAVDFLSQYAGGAVGLGDVQLSGGRSRLSQTRAAKMKKPLNFDTIGLGLLELTMASWEIMLSKGQEWDWLGDPFWRIQTLLGLFVGGLSLLVWRELGFKNPLIRLSRCSWIATSARVASSFSVPTPCFMPTQLNCRRCCKRSSATTRPPRDWCCRRRDCLPSWCC